MKRSNFMIILLVLVIVFSLCACGKAKDKISEKTMEKIVEDAIGGNVNITEDGGKVEINGETYEAGENLEWPKDAMGKIPKPAANVTFVMKGDVNTGCTVALDEFSIDDAKEYVDKLKELGFKDGMDMSDSDGIIFSGKDSKGYLVNFVYNSSAEEGTIAYTPEGAE